jgi:outer membrane immunogenic protein
MKKVLLASAAVILSGNAFAAKLPPKMPANVYAAAPVAPVSWTGCHVGVHAGAGWNRARFSDPTGFNIAPFGSTVNVDSGPGLVGGVQLGCDYQFATNWVLGLAGDFSWANISHDEVDPFFAGKTFGVPLTVQAKTQSLGSVTARLGYAWNQYLVFVKGGPAWAREKYAVNNFACVIFVSCYSNATTTRPGWTAGGGIEWAFMPAWSVVVEYSHYGFGTDSFTFVNPPTGTATTFGVKQDVDVVKVGLNYRFGTPFR